ncbi:hypothetical protein GIB67_023861 [Kingdonia uniflora]|uniref:Replication protein A OB domain-containing protein n=1 Tax=Kingdonia uniflora TaxID=39325 RepID=A0A7J7NFY7_9MAGN|nr:hypothetical protein GIB67_023861 [Kingdonia uniflora]
MWTAKNFATCDIRSLDMLFIDEHGDQIHAVVPKEVIHQFTEQLHEGELIHVEKFNISTNNATYRPVAEGELKIYFSIDTVVKKLENQDVSIPMHKFSFVDFNVIGKLNAITEIERIKKRNGEISPKRDIIIEDTSGSTIKITVWDDMLDQIPFNVDGLPSSPAIMIVTSTTVDMFQGTCYLKPTSATKMYLNLKIPEVTSLLNSLTLLKDVPVKLLANPQRNPESTTDMMFEKRKELIEIFTIMTENSSKENGPHLIEQILQKIIGSTYVFQFQITEYNITGAKRSFTVSKLWLVDGLLEANDLKRKNVTKDLNGSGSSNENGDNDAHKKICKRVNITNSKETVAHTNVSLSVILKYVTLMVSFNEEIVERTSSPAIIKSFPIDFSLLYSNIGREGIIGIIRSKIGNMFTNEVFWANNKKKIIDYCLLVGRENILRNSATVNMKMEIDVVSTISDYDEEEGLLAMEPPNNPNVQYFQNPIDGLITSRFETKNYNYNIRCSICWDDYIKGEPVICDAATIFI